ncbi:MAG: DUF2840 domain-containing protein [Alphaproteobacteria bacterium]|nr:DUF2840 domain-containing protein [Alphaproteobacteria bacterium]
MNRVGLSLTGEFGLSLTAESAYRKPKSALTNCRCCELQPLNYANSESYGFFLTQSRARRFACVPSFADSLQDLRTGFQERRLSSQTLLPEGCHSLGSAANPSGRLHTDSPERKPFPRDHFTHVELFWQEGVREHWLRFGRQVGDRIIDRRRRVVSFAPGAIFAFIRWAANDYGTISSNIDIVRAVSRSEAYSTLPHVDPGGEILLHLHGWPKVVQVLRAIDTIEALGIAPEDVAPDHWRHIHNRLSAGLPPRSYSPARHQAWLSREGMTP